MNFLGDSGVDGGHVHCGVRSGSVDVPPVKHCVSCQSDAVSPVSVTVRCPASFESTVSSHDHGAMQCMDGAAAMAGPTSQCVSMCSPTLQSGKRFRVLL